MEFLKESSSEISVNVFSSGVCTAFHKNNSSFPFPINISNIIFIYSKNDQLYSAVPLYTSNVSWAIGIV